MTERESEGAGERETGAAAYPGAGPSAAAQPEARPEVDAPGIGAPSPALPLPHSAVLAWLSSRETPPPPELRERMEAALAGVRSETIPGALAEAALACVQTTLGSPEERASALDLLAADALLTYAIEAAAELGVEMLRDVTGAYGPERLGELLRPGNEAP